MKTKDLIPVLFVLFLGCEKQPPEVPENVIILEPVAKLVDSLGVLMPENGDAVLASPDLFSETAEKNIVLTKESEVFVTFIDEVASFTNTLCWYSYDPWDPPLKSSDITQNVLFPNISKKGEGGQLEAGYTVQLGTGKFPAGTIIGFSLIIGGWEDGTINYSKPVHYTDCILNLDGLQKHVLFKLKSFNYVVVGFEDQELGKDFNDILFSVTDNKDAYAPTSFDLSKVASR